MIKYQPLLKDQTGREAAYTAHRIKQGGFCENISRGRGYTQKKSLL